MKTAIDIYIELSDMDYRDYDEQKEADLAYIESVIDQCGSAAALDKLMSIFD